MAIIESRLKVLIIKALMCRDIRGGAARQGGNARWRRDGNPMSSALYIFCARASTCTYIYTRVVYALENSYACTSGEGNIAGVTDWHARGSIFTLRGEARYNDNNASTKAFPG